MNKSIRTALQIATAMLLVAFTGTASALAGPAPIEPEFPPPAAEPQPAASDAFPWMLTSIAVVLTVTAVALIAVLWHRAHTSHHHHLVTP